MIFEFEYIHQFKMRLNYQPFVIIQIDIKVEVTTEYKFKTLLLNLWWRLVKVGRGVWNPGKSKCNTSKYSDCIKNNLFKS